MGDEKHERLIGENPRFVSIAPRCFIILLIFLALAGKTNNLAATPFDIGDYEGRRIASVEVVIEGSASDPSVQAEFLSFLRIAPNTEYSAVLVRDSLQALLDSKRVASARVEVSESAAEPNGVRNNRLPLKLRFVIQRQVLIGDVTLELGNTSGTPVSEDELRARLNIVRPGTRLSKQALIHNIDEIQIYLRDRGYFNAAVEFTEQLEPGGIRTNVVYKITLGEQARISNFSITVTGFDPASIQPSLALKQGAPFTRQALGEDLKRIREATIGLGFLAPLLDDPRVERDPDSNRIAITLSGKIGPKVNVTVKDYQISEKKARELLPVKREGNIDESVIVESGRRLRNKVQEEGYFFAEVVPVCSVTPPVPDKGPNGVGETCKNLNAEDLGGHTVDVTYEVERGRRFRLGEIRIEGTNKLTPQDIEGELKSQKANVLGIIPFLGYGRGYTSQALLDQDERVIASYMHDLGYRHATVHARQGVSINGESLIITFKVDEGPLTRIASVTINGSKIFTEARLRDELRTVIGAPYSRTAARADNDRLLNFYAREGYIEAKVKHSIVDLPKKGDDEQIELVYDVQDEGLKVFINRIIIIGVTGDAKTQQIKRKAILRAIPLAEAGVLRADRMAESERALYVTDAFRQVIIGSEPAGETASGFKKQDVIIEVEEKKPRVLDYGGGYSTDTGALGLFEITNQNFMNRLWQGSVRLRASQRAQLLRFEYLDPFFARYGEGELAPLVLSVQYLRDSTITRFFRSAIDQGTFGIVQRLDDKGRPIDQSDQPQPAGEPTINRFTVSAETQRILNRKTKTIIFGRYSYEDVRLYNLNSLVVQPILQPDRAIRLSRLGASFVRDTRERCERGLPGSYEESSSRSPGVVCRYNQLDPTRGDFLNLDYTLALRQLGGNVSFNRFQMSYRSYYKANSLRGTILAGNLTLGLSNLFNPRDRDGKGIGEIDRTLPISERFFSGGSTTLRGFGFEEAGPRQVIIPKGTFRDQKGNIISLNPFTVPVGGNALAIVNLEARIPVTRDFQAVPFYDGGNVFRRVGDLFGRHDQTPIPSGDAANLRAHWTHTVGLGFRIQTPFGGALAVDYGFLLNAPKFLIPQGTLPKLDGPPAVYRLNQGQLHFRFTQTF